MKLLKTKLINDNERYYLFGFLPIFQTKIKKPFFDENTFFVWETCSQNHAEVVPGYTKYLLDLGYKVSVLYSQVKSNNGLFSRFAHNDNLFVNKLTKKEALKFFKYFGLQNSKGIIITTAGAEYDRIFKFTENAKDNQKVLKVEHSSTVYDSIPKDEKIITLRKMEYNGATTIEINPHYFGNIKVTDKNDTITNFVVIGALKKDRRNISLLIDAVKSLHDKGISNFKITVVGKGSLSNLPQDIRQYFDIKGRLNFADLYSEMEKGDYFLPLLDVNNKGHENTITTSTSGSFQLIYGFRKPPVMAEKFATVNGYTTLNSILYKNNEDFVSALEQAINLSKDDYKNLQTNLAEFSDILYNRSLENMRRLINE